jgi:putative hydrolase of the HAD superfamily
VIVRRLAIFDLDGTLVDRQEAFSEAVAALCRTRGLGAVAEQWLFTELGERANAADFVRFREAFGLDESAGQLWRAYVDAMAATVQCRPAVLDGLAQLRATGWTIGIANNGASEIRRAKLAATGICDLADGIAVSGDNEIRKPDVRLFELAAARCGRELSEGGWMIGDNPEGDTEGGRRAGLRTIWLCGRPWPDTIPAPHHAVDDVTDAISLLLNNSE